MEPDVLEKLRTAGRVSREAKEVGVAAVKEGALLLDVAEEIEAHMRRRGTKPAFPTCISIDDVAAHYSPTHDDALRFRRGDVVKLDLGAHLDGWVADTAVTIEVGTRNWTELIRASDLALATAIEGVRPGVPTRTLGAGIQRAIEAHGFKPIRNLTGHTIERYVLHAGKSVPNIPHGHDVLAADEVVAIEPFSSSGAGQVDGRRTGNIYRVLRTRSLKVPELNAFLSDLVVDFRTLPFAERWAYALDPKAPALLNQLLRVGAVMTYPALLDTGKGIVAQTEHTMIVRAGGAEVTTA
ncbi:MAG: type II methionyl aminopeptidase [Euryarchaeota archaeon RBG_19FT_COMBO_69_17]|nr:MAG: type II methionyl aminopeptidase [Euryarchaeota archaeon RBG_19FT_COMBO_69_17]